MFRLWVAVWVSVNLLACTSMRPVDATRTASVRAAVKVGDEVSVKAVNGKTYLLVLTAVDEQKIVGIGDNKKVTIRYEQITALEVRKLSTGKTVGLTASIVTVIGVVLVAIFASNFGKALETLFGGKGE